MATKKTGKSGYWTFAGTRIPFNKLTPKVGRTLADSTDSASYDAASDLLHKEQLAVDTQTELSVEGKFDFSTIPTAVLNRLYTNQAAGAVVVAYENGTIYGHGNMDIEDFECTIDTSDVTSYSATLKSNGLWTPNA